MQKANRCTGGAGRQNRSGRADMHRETQRREAEERRNRGRRSVSKYRSTVAQGAEEEAQYGRRRQWRSMTRSHEGRNVTQHSLPCSLCTQTRCRRSAQTEVRNKVQKRRQKGRTDARRA